MRLGGETITDEVLHEARKILGAECTTVHDIVETAEASPEDTHDWYAQDVYGNV